MKNKILFITTTLLLCACTKNESRHLHNTNYNHKCSKEELKMSADLVPYFDSYIEDCKKHNINYDHIYCLDWMQFGDLNHLQGLTDLYDGTIEFKRVLTEDTIGMKFVVYHELGHWMGLEHSNGIMKYFYNTNEDMEWAKNNWDELVADYFNKLKN